MSRVLNIKKALRVQAKLQQAFADTPGVRVTVTAVEDRAIRIEAAYHGVDDYEVLHGDETYTAEHPSDHVLARDLWKTALHPLDHWVDVQVQIEEAAKRGQL